VCWKKVESSWGEGLQPSPRTSPLLSAFVLYFRLFRPQSPASPNNLHFPLMLRGLDKNTGSALFSEPKNAWECRVLYSKYRRISGVTALREGRHFLTPSYPVSTRQMLGPSASSRLATALSRPFFVWAWLSNTDRETDKAFLYIIFFYLFHTSSLRDRQMRKILLLNPPVTDAGSIISWGGLTVNQFLFDFRLYFPCKLNVIIVFTIFRRTRCRKKRRCQEEYRSIHSASSGMYS